MRKKILSLHLLLASFMAPAFIMVAISGGLYLVGVKGTTSELDIAVSGQYSLDLKSADLETDVQNLIKQMNLNIDFEYLKARGSTVTTRPTSRDYLEFSTTEEGLKIRKISPDIQASMMELHKGHGPTLYKTYQKLVALGLIFVMLSGLWMGISNKMMRKKTLTAALLGLVAFILLAFT